MIARDLLVALGRALVVLSAPRFDRAVDALTRTRGISLVRAGHGLLACGATALALYAAAPAASETIAAWDAAARGSLTAEITTALASGEDPSEATWTPVLVVATTSEVARFRVEQSPGAWDVVLVDNDVAWGATTLPALGSFDARVVRTPDATIIRLQRSQDGRAPHVRARGAHVEIAWR